ncbi:MAG: GTP-binding protein [Betaproteobacteria bacterium]|nr:GTP-binding protein [Betaproteobacteria bacterium]
MIRTEQPVDMAGLGMFLNRVTNSMREQLLRIKGVANVKSRPRHVKSQGPLVVHAVREKFYALQWLDAWPDADRSTRLVFIGRELDGAGLDCLFEQLCL